MAVWNYQRVMNSPRYHHGCVISTFQPWVPSPSHGRGGYVGNDQRGRHGGVHIGEKNLGAQNSWQLGPISNDQKWIVAASGDKLQKTHGIQWLCLCFFPTNKTANLGFGLCFTSRQTSSSNFAQQNHWRLVSRKHRVHLIGFCHRRTWSLPCVCNGNWTSRWVFFWAQLGFCFDCEKKKDIRILVDINWDLSGFSK